MKLNSVYWGILFLLVIPLNLYSQVSNWSLEFRQKVGFLAAHRVTMAHLPERLAFPVEFSWIIKPSGTKKWHQTYKLPEHGISLFHGPVGNDKILGRFTGIYGFIQIPIIKPTNSFRLDWQFGTGLGYTPKIYDPIENPKNIAIGSHINGLMCLGIYSKYYFGMNKLSFAIDITHFSNGAFRVPNLGVNVFCASLSYSRNIGSFNSNKNFTSLDDKFKMWNIGATAIFTVKETYNDNPKKYPVYGLNIFARKIFNPKAGIELSLDLISKQAVKAYFPEIPKSQWDIFQMGIFAAYLLPIDHLHFVFGMGAYIKDKFQPEDPLYHKIGVRYQFNNGFNAQWILKTHFGRADYFEAGIGYSFPIRKQK